MREVAKSGDGEGRAYRYKEGERIQQVLQPFPLSGIGGRDRASMN